MNWISLVVLTVLGGIGILLFWRRRQRRLTLTQHTLRCPEHDCRASVAVRTDPIADPSGRYVDVTACSLRPAMWFVPPVRKVYFADMSPPSRTSAMSIRRRVTRTRSRAPRAVCAC